MISKIVRSLHQRTSTLVPKTESARSIETSPGDKSGLPLLSVVVPCYKVEQYLAATLDTILSQKSVNLEVIVVDDGSPDESGAIARRLATSDARIRVISQDNAGLGAARNTGIRHARGKYLTFADSDDFVPKDSYSTMVAQLESSGSDFVVGSVERRHGLKTWIPEWAQSVHRFDKVGAILEDDLEILKDVFAWNKVFRRTFWDENIREFPVDIRYEDQGPTAIAYTKSNKFDVLKKVVYTWVIREDGSSITQQKARIEDLVDRLEVMRNVSTILQRESTPEIHKSWIIKSIGFDLKPYYDQVPRTSGLYWSTLSAGVQELDAYLVNSDWNQIPFWERVMAQSMLHGNEDDMGIVVATRQEMGHGYEIRRMNSDSLRCHADFLDTLSFRIDENILEPSPDSLRLRSELTSVAWVSGHEVEVCGAVWISGLGPKNHDYNIKAELVSTCANSDYSSIPLEVSSIRLDDEFLLKSDSYNDYAESGIKFLVDTRLIPIQKTERNTDLAWKVMLSVSVDEIARSGPFMQRSVLGPAVAYSQGELQNRERIALKFDEADGLIFNIPTRKPIAKFIKIERRNISLSIDKETANNFDRLILRSKHHRDLSFVSSSNNEDSINFEFELPILDDTLSGAAMWELRLANRNTSSLIQYGSSSHNISEYSSQGSRVCVDLSSNGFIRISEKDFAICVSSCNLDLQSELIVINGTFDSPHFSSSRLFFEGNNGFILNPESTEFDHNTNSFVACFSLKTTTWGSAEVSIPEGGYALKASRSGTVIQHKNIWVPVSRELQCTLPMNILTTRSRVRLSRTEKAGALWLNIYAPHQSPDRGRAGQRNLMSMSRKIQPTPKPLDATLFESFSGSTVSDSPLALFEYARDNSLGGALYWTIKDGSVEVPDGAEPLLLHSSKYHKVLNSASHLVNNNNFPFYFRKNEHQFYLQTWHGTPLKKIGNDVPNQSLSVTYRRLMKREASSWDALLAQNSYAAEQFSRAFDFSGPIWQEGYPRNDSLVASLNNGASESIRRSLGLKAHQHVVLYAPTWRDNVRTASNNYDLVNYLDFKSIEARFDDSVVVLLRGHSNTLRSNRVFRSRNVVDVSTYPDINDLIIASDSLITDYSSLMFDYSVTRKPIIILAPDLEEYETSTRGFYFNFRDSLPGPLTQSTEEVIDVLSGDLFRYSFMGLEYRDRFAPADDGLATRRIASKLWGTR